MRDIAFTTIQAGRDWCARFENQNGFSIYRVMRNQCDVHSKYGTLTLHSGDALVALPFVDHELRDKKTEQLHSSQTITNPITSVTLNGRQTKIHRAHIFEPCDPQIILKRYESRLLVFRHTAKEAQIINRLLNSLFSDSIFTLPGQIASVASKHWLDLKEQL